MKPLKKLILICLLTLPVSGIFAQALSTYTVGTAINFAGSNKMNTAPGLAFAFGAQGKTMFANNFAFTTEEQIYYGTVAFNYKTRDQGGNFTVDNTTPYAFGGLTYIIGAEYYIVPKAFSAGLGLFASYNFPPINVTTLNDDVISVDNSGNQVSASEIAATMGGINYGIHIGATYRFDKVGVSLSYNYGLNNFTSGLYDGYNIHYYHLEIQPDARPFPSSGLAFLSALHTFLINQDYKRLHSS